jgi:hypothetical protein
MNGRGLFARISTDDAAFREVHVDYGTLVWPGPVDIAPKTLIWDGPCPQDEEGSTPEPFLRVRRPSYAGALYDAYGDATGALPEERASWPGSE